MLRYLLLAPLLLLPACSLLHRTPPGPPFVHTLTGTSPLRVGSTGMCATVTAVVTGPSPACNELDFRNIVIEPAGCPPAMQLDGKE